MNTQPHLPQLVPIEAYGNGGFRFGGMSHRGSILCVPSGIYAWPVTAAGHETSKDFERVLAEAANISLVLFGAGETFHRPAASAAQALSDAGIGVDPMDTGAACRTFNILLAEQRSVAAALIAVP